MSDLYLFIDESGNFDFSAKGSQYFILTAVATTNPAEGAHRLLEWRHHILTCDGTTLKTKRPRDCTHFHCTEDAQYTRDGVFKVVETLGLEAYSVIVQKNKTMPPRQSPEGLYETSFGGLVKGIVRRKGTSAKFHIFAAEFQVKSKKAAFLGALKAALAGEKGLTYQVHFHPSQSHHMLQVADYVCWAIARKYEMGDDRSHKIVSKLIKNEFDLFRKGTTTYY